MSTTGGRGAMRLRNLRRRLLLPVVASLALVATVAAPSPASAATADEQRVLDLTNQVRASVGAQPLTLDESISVTARRWAATVAAAGRISHNPDAGGVSNGSSALAENVVVGTSIQAGQAALVASPGHYANMVNPVVSRVGIGVVWAGGMVYIVEDFLIVRGATAPAVPTSPPTTARPAATPPSTVAASAPPASLQSGAPPTTAPVAGPGPGAATSPPGAAAGPSVWLALSFDVLRSWERAAG